jgi:hypothetical protein
MPFNALSICSLCHMAAPTLGALAGLRAVHHHVHGHHSSF